MIYAEIQNNQIVLKYPYSKTDLHLDNPSSEYDDRFTLVEWYAQTEKASSNNSALVEVAISDCPSYDPNMQTAQQASLPELVDDVWTVGWVVTNATITPAVRLAHEL